MPKYFLTVGQKYRDEPHPIGLHPDHFYAIEALNYSDALAIVFNSIGNRWAFLYPEQEFHDKELYTHGELPFPAEI